MEALASYGERDMTAADQLKALPGLSPNERADAFERLLRDPSPSVRAAAIRVGASILSDDAIAAYLRNGEDDVLRNAGLEMLKDRGPAAMELGTRLLGDRDADVVLQAVLLLDHLGDPRGLEPLRDVLGHPNANVVQAAITAVGNLGHGGVVPDLLPFLEAGLWLQMAAVEALGKLRAPAALAPLAALLPDPMLGPLAADALTRIGGVMAFEHLAEYWVGDGGLSRDRMELLAHVLEGTTGKVAAVDRVMVGLRAALDNEAREVRVAAARCLLVLGPGPDDGPALDLLASNWGDPGAMPSCLRRRPELMGTLLASEGIRRGWGFKLAAEFPYRVPEDLFGEAIEVTTERQHFATIADALYSSTDPRMGCRIVRLYGRVPSEVRVGWGPLIQRYAASVRDALESETDIAAPVRRVLSAALVEDGAAAARAVTALGPEERLEALAHVVNRADVLHHLPWLDWLREAPDLYGSYAVRVAAAAGLANASSAIRRALRDKPHRDLIRLVGTLRDRESVGTLQTILESDAEHLKPFALAALGNIGSSESRRWLRRQCQWAGRWVRFAYRALAECWEESDLDVFRLGAEHEDWHVRMICASVLRQADRPEDVTRVALLAADPVPAVAQHVRGRAAS